MILADKITEERKKNGWSQEELANQLGVSRQAVSKWESAGAVPDLQRILQMSELFGVSTDYLLKDEMKAENITYHESTESYAEPLKKVTMENANEFLDMKRNGSKVVANATSMCILSPILLIVLVTMAEDSVFHVSESLATVFGCVFLLGMVAAAVFLFITYGMSESHMEHFEKECFETEYGVSGMVREKKDSYEPIFIRGTAVGVVLCILAVIPTIIAESMEASDYYCGLSVGLLLFILAIGVNLLVRVGMVKSSYDTLLQEGEYTKEEVRVIAEKIGLLVADKPDSQDICFVQDGNYAAFIEEHTGKKASEGNFVTSDGTVIGRHKGIIHYTVGQRKGLGLALEKPLISIPTTAAIAYNIWDTDKFVCPIMDARRNQVYTGVYCYTDHRLDTVWEQDTMSIEALAEGLNCLDHEVIFLGDGVAVYREKLEALLTIPFSFAPAHVNRQRAAAVGALAEVYYKEGKIQTAEEHEPEYLRKSQAERERAERESVKHADVVKKQENGEKSE